MADINTATISGRLTRDPEIRYTQGGTAVTTLGVAFSHSRKNNAGEWEDVANFIDVTVWGQKGEFLSRKLAKGSLVFITGRLQWESWESDAGKRSAIKLIAHEVKSQDLFKPRSKDNAPAQDLAPDDDGFIPITGPADSDDDIPF